MKHDVENDLKEKGHKNPKANIIFVDIHMVLEVQVDKSSQRETMHSWAPSNYSGKSKVSKSGRVAEIKDRMARLVQCQSKNNDVSIPTVLSLTNQDDYTVKTGSAGGGKIAILCKSIEVANKVEEQLRGSSLIEKVNRNRQWMDA